MVIGLQLWWFTDSLLQYGNPLPKGLQEKFHNILLRADPGTTLEEDRLFACLNYTSVLS
jgi:hypothetical protein